MDAVPSVTFSEAWSDCKRLLPAGWDLHLRARANGTFLALAENGNARRWCDGADEVAALEGLEDRLLEEVAEGIE